MASSWVELITTTEAAKPPDDVLKEAVRFLTDVAKLQDPNMACGVAEADLEKLQLPDSLPAAAGCSVDPLSSQKRGSLAQGQVGPSGYKLSTRLGASVCKNLGFSFGASKGA